MSATTQPVALPDTEVVKNGVCWEDEAQSPKSAPFAQVQYIVTLSKRNGVGVTGVLLDAGRPWSAGVPVDCWSVAFGRLSVSKNRVNGTAGPDTPKGLYGAGMPPSFLPGPRVHFCIPSASKVDVHACHMPKYVLTSRSYGGIEVSSDQRSQPALVPDDGNRAHQKKTHPSDRKHRSASDQHGEHILRRVWGGIELRNA